MAGDRGSLHGRRREGEGRGERLSGGRRLEGPPGREDANRPQAVANSCICIFHGRRGWSHAHVSPRGGRSRVAAGLA